MPSRLLIIQGHPDPAGGHFCHALAENYVEGAASGGHEVRRIDVARLDFPLLRSAAEFNTGPLPASLEEAQRALVWAEHLLLVFPLWMGDMPALLKGFIEQVARPGFAFDGDDRGPFGKKKLQGRSARVVVTMGMPALVYRYIYRAHSVKALERNILGFIGIAPIHETLIGQVEGEESESARQRWLRRLRELGEKGE
jgi:putative NADPH-quinone reductase